MSRKKIWEKKKRFPKENRASFKKKNIKSLKKQGLLAEGVFIGNARGFGFVETGEDEEDIFIPADAVNTALHQDRVQVLLKKEQKPGKRREGTVIKILERGTTEVVGTFQREGDYGFVLCDNQKISRDVYISPKNSHGIRDGEKVVAQILDYGSEKRKPEGKITESLGNIHAPGADILAVVKSYGIPSEFPVRVMNQAMCRIMFWKRTGTEETTLPDL